MALIDLYHITETCSEQSTLADTNGFTLTISSSRSVSDWSDAIFSSSRRHCSCAC